MEARISRRVSDEVGAGAARLQAEPSMGLKFNYGGGLLNSNVYSPPYFATGESAF